MEIYKQIFRDFTAPYLQKAAPEKKADVELKFMHSFEVYKNSCAICESIDLTGEQAETVQIAALFHDTGRFPQFEKYGTFRDADSCNHATTGVRTILRHHLLESLSPARRKNILAAIALHNRRQLPEKLAPEIRLATDIVRDSDKVDIIKILLSHMQDIRPESNVALMGLKDIPGLVSEPVLQSIENGQQANYLDMKSVNDFRLLILSWAYDLNFRWSRQQMKSLGHVDLLFSQLPDTERITNLYDPIMEQLNS
ncbi:HD domain-containing protein [Maridesulfovibrio sp. FT414]|uniref:HD domain-containing protein n=1 Tax=Maridesulfovibrio sp. FT414 TaxID=2979469 RepID=UPI003D805AA9